MIRKLQADKANKTVALEMSENDLNNIIESIDRNGRQTTKNTIRKHSSR
jgi:hypothetical protein